MRLVLLAPRGISFGCGAFVRDGEACRARFADRRVDSELPIVVEVGDVAVNPRAKRTPFRLAQLDPPVAFDQKLYERANTGPP